MPRRLLRWADVPYATPAWLGPKSFSSRPASEASVSPAVELPRLASPERCIRIQAPAPLAAPAAGPRPVGRWGRPSRPGPRHPSAAAVGPGRRADRARAADRREPSGPRPVRPQTSTPEPPLRVRLPRPSLGPVRPTQRGSGCGSRPGPSPAGRWRWGPGTARRRRPGAQHPGRGIAAGPRADRRRRSPTCAGARRHPGAPCERGAHGRRPRWCERGAAGRRLLGAGSGCMNRMGACVGHLGNRPRPANDRGPGASRSQGRLPLK